jgi:hypothetical protein
MITFIQWLTEVKLFRTTSSENDNGLLTHYGSKAIVRDFHNDFPQNKKNRVKVAEVDLGNVHHLGPHSVYGSDHSAEGLTKILHKDGIFSKSEHDKIIGKEKLNSDIIKKRLVKKLKSKKIHTLAYKYPWSRKQDKRPLETAHILIDPSTQIKKSRTSKSFPNVRMR